MFVHFQLSPSSSSRFDKECCTFQYWATSFNYSTKRDFRDDFRHSHHYPISTVPPQRSEFWNMCRLGRAWASNECFFDKLNQIRKNQSATNLVKPVSCLWSSLQWTLAIESQQEVTQVGDASGLTNPINQKIAPSGLIKTDFELEQLDRVMRVVLMLLLLLRCCCWQRHRRVSWCKGITGHVGVAPNTHRRERHLPAVGKNWNMATLRRQMVHSW